MIGVLGYRGLLGSTIVGLYPEMGRVEFASRFALEETIKEHKPEALINCLGVTPNSPRSNQMFQMNSEFPRWLSETCTKHEVRLVHVSTDCVFDGREGGYVENNKPNATTDYGISKAGGEVVYYPHLVVRTSFVGWPDPARRGLFAWLMEHQGKTVQGFSAALWNGLTVDVLADVLVDLARRSRIWGVRHIFNIGHQITKYDLLKLANDEYQLDCTIVPVSAPKINRTLRTLYDDIPCLYDIEFRSTYQKMIRRMHERLGNVNTR